MDESDYFDYVKSGCADEESFNQEYMCVTADDEGAFIEFELIDKCKIKGDGKTGVDDKQKKKGKWVCEWRSADPIGNGALYIGWDLAKISDLSVLWMAEDVAGRLVTRRVKAMHKMDFSEQYKEVDEYMSMRNVRRMCMDASGMGERPYEEMRAAYGWTVEGVKFTGQAKEAMAYKLRGDMEDAKFLIPDERFVVADLRKMRKIVTAANNIRFEGERDKDGHSDRFWAAALCREAKGSNSDAWADPGDVDELDALDDMGAAPRSIHPYASGYRRIY
jgi:phage FluMu gp28-like protein